jgi:hypothetical protein
VNEVVFAGTEEICLNPEPDDRLRSIKKPFSVVLASVQLNLICVLETATTEKEPGATKAGAVPPSACALNGSIAKYAVKTKMSFKGPPTNAVEIAVNDFDYYEEPPVHLRQTLWRETSKSTRGSFTAPKCNSIATQIETHREFWVDAMNAGPFTNGEPTSRAEQSFDLLAHPFVKRILMRSLVPHLRDRDGVDFDRRRINFDR